MVFQQALLLKWRTVLENVLLPAEILGLPMKAARARARELLDLVGLTGYEDKYPQQLSGGMQQRAAIARALIHDPKLVLMDEPFGALDALTREQMNLEMLRIWRESGKTFVFVTHSIQEAVFLGSRCAVLTAGPARMADYFPIDLPFPRTLPIKTTDEFGAYARRIYEKSGSRRHARDLISECEIALQAGPRSADRTQSPAAISQKREFSECRPETIGYFALKTLKIGRLETGG